MHNFIKFRQLWNKAKVTSKFKRMEYLWTQLDACTLWKSDRRKLQSDPWQMSYSISLYTHQVFLFCSNYTTRLSRYLDKTTHARNTQFEVKNKMAESLGNFVKGNNSLKALKDYFKNIAFKMSLEMLIWSVWSKIIEGIFKKSSFNNILF